MWHARSSLRGNRSAAFVEREREVSNDPEIKLSLNLKIIKLNNKAQNQTISVSAHQSKPK